MQTQHLKPTNSVLEIINQHARIVALYNAALTNDTDAVATLLSTQVNPNSGDASNTGDTPLMAAALKGHVEVAQLLLDGGASLEMTNKLGASALHIATQYCEHRMVAFLIQQGAQVDAGMNEGHLTALHLASESNHLVIATLLMENGASPNRAHRQLGDTPLHVAAKNGFYAMAALLVQSKADVNARMNVVGYTPLDYAVQNNHTRMVRLLLESGANPNQKNLVDGGTPLHHAIENNYVAIAKRLIQAGANVQAMNQIGNTSLHLAAATNNLVLAEMLLTQDARTARIKSSITGHTPLQVALDHNHFAMASLLVSHGAKLADLFYPSDSTLLNVYISRGDIVKTQWLLANGASLDIACDKYGYYPMELAHQYDNTDMVNVLLRHQSHVLHTSMLDMACNENNPLGKNLGLMQSVFLPAYHPQN